MGNLMKELNNFHISFVSLIFMFFYVVFFLTSHFTSAKETAFFNANTAKCFSSYISTELNFKTFPCFVVVVSFHVYVKDILSTAT